MFNYLSWWLVDFSSPTAAHKDGSMLATVFAPTASQKNIFYLKCNHIDKIILVEELYLSC